MGLFAKLSTSTDLVNGMADRLGTDMAALLGHDPEMRGPRLRRMVLRCSTCSAQAACTRLQADSVSLSAPPDYCRNKQALDVGRAT